MLRALRTCDAARRRAARTAQRGPTLADDLAELVRLRTAIAADRDSLRGELAALRAKQLRLDALVEARQSRGSEIEREAGRSASGRRNSACAAPLSKN
jgi:septal ring factor EnvC (AmiA/AmiB activator)